MTRGKLTRPAVDAIKMSLREGIEGKILARLYEVSEATISRIKHGSRWAKANWKYNPNCKLTHSQVVAIKRELAKGTSTTLLARRYGVSQPAISNIKNGKRWGHVQ
jgi:predicted transcriptional regulator